MSFATLVSVAAPCAAMRLCVWACALPLVFLSCEAAASRDAARESSKLNESSAGTTEGVLLSTLIDPPNRADLCYSGDDWRTLQTFAESLKVDGPELSAAIRTRVVAEKYQAARLVETALGAPLFVLWDRSIDTLSHLIDDTKWGVALGLGGPENYCEAFGPLHVFGRHPGNLTTVTNHLAWNGAIALRTFKQDASPDGESRVASWYVLPACRFADADKFISTSASLGGMHRRSTVWRLYTSDEVMSLLSPSLKWGDDVSTSDELLLASDVPLRCEIVIPNSAVASEEEVRGLVSTLSSKLSFWVADDMVGLGGKAEMASAASVVLLLPGLALSDGKRKLTVSIARAPSMVSFNLSD